MYSENFMKYLIAYQSDEIEQKTPVYNKKPEKRYSMAELIGVKYATIPVKYSTK